MRCSARAADDWLSPSATHGFLFQLPGLSGRPGRGGFLFGPPFFSSCARADWPAVLTSQFHLCETRATLALPSFLSSILRPPFVSSLRLTRTSPTLSLSFLSLPSTSANSIVNSTPLSVLHNQFSTSTITSDSPDLRLPLSLPTARNEKPDFRAPNGIGFRDDHTQATTSPPHNGGVATRRLPVPWTVYAQRGPRLLNTHISAVARGWFCDRF